MKHKKLKRCPFCGWNEIDVYEEKSGIDGLAGKYYAMCATCFAQTGTHDTVGEAVNKWNMRKGGYENTNN
jgi:Lar family restriction alleviation protein